MLQSLDDGFMVSWLAGGLFGCFMTGLVDWCNNTQRMVNVHMLPDDGFQCRFQVADTELQDWCLANTAGCHAAIGLSFSSSQIEFACKRAYTKFYYISTKHLSASITVRVNL